MEKFRFQSLGEVLFIALTIFIASTVLTVKARGAATITVNSPEDSGTVGVGDNVLTLSEALRLATGILPLNSFSPLEQRQVSGTPGANSSDEIRFNATAFPKEKPVPIRVSSPLPALSTGNDAINAVNAGAILDGSNLSTGSGITITSDNNQIKGLKIQKFPDHGILIQNGSKNIIGGPGDGNQISLNGLHGVAVIGSLATGNTIRENSITDNVGLGIITLEGGNGRLIPPIIIGVFPSVIITGTVSTTTLVINGIAIVPDGSIVEIFSDPAEEGAEILGFALVQGGNFTFSLPTTPAKRITATVTDPLGNTSQFSGTKPIALIKNDFVVASVDVEGLFTVGKFPSIPLLFGHPVPETSFTSFKIDGVNAVLKSTVSRVGKDVIETKAERGKISVLQTISIISGTTTENPDTVMISYLVTNNDTQPHSVGCRILMDTMIKDNDDSPFNIPGIGAATKEIELLGDRVPDTYFVFDQLPPSNTLTAQGTLKIPRILPPDRFVLASWPDIQRTDFDYPVDPTREISGPDKDSAVAIFWNPVTLNPNGGSVTFITFYGLGGVTVQPGNLTIALTGPVEVKLNDLFQINASITNTDAVNTARDVTVEISLSEGLQLAPGQALSQSLGDIPPKGSALATFNLLAVKSGSQTYSVTLKSSNFPSNSAQRSIDVKPLAPATISLNPSSGQMGETLDITITGQDTNFKEGVSSVDFGVGIELNKLTVSSPTKAVANITILLNAKGGERKVVITTLSEVASGSFTVSPSKGLDPRPEDLKDGDGPNVAGIITLPPFPVPTTFDGTIRDIVGLLTTGGNLAKEVEEALPVPAKISQDPLLGTIAIDPVDGPLVFLMPFNDNIQSITPDGTQTPGIAIDAASGLITIKTASGVNLELVSFPYNISEFFSTFIDNLRGFGLPVRQVNFLKGRIKISTPLGTILLRPAFIVQETLRPPGIRFNNLGELIINYKDRKRQKLFPVIGDEGQFRDKLLREGGRDIRIGFDGTVEFSKDGLRFKMRPDFIIFENNQPSGIKFEDGRLVITYDDRTGQVFAPVIQ